MSILLIVIVGVLWGGMAILMNRAAKNPEDVRSATVVSSLVFPATAIPIFLQWDVVTSGATDRLPETIAVMIPAAVLNFAGTLLMMRTMARGNSGVSWAVGQSAMVVPFSLSIVFWGDRLSLGGGLGILLVVGMIFATGILSQRSDAGGPRSDWLPLLLATFISIGVSQTLFSIPSRWENWTDTGGIRVSLMALVTALCGVTLALGRPLKLNRVSVLTGFGLGLLMTISESTLFLSMDALSVAGLISLAFPLAIGVSLVGFGIYSWLILKEVPTGGQALWMFVGLVGLLLLGWNGPN